LLQERLPSVTIDREEAAALTSTFSSQSPTNETLKRTPKLTRTREFSDENDENDETPV
jgi:hypothetical protein